jgi:hypothetical protein
MCICIITGLSQQEKTTFQVDFHFEAGNVDAVALRIVIVLLKRLAT